MHIVVAGNLSKPALRNVNTFNPLTQTQQKYDENNLD